MLFRSGIIDDIAALKEKDITPALAVFRVGSRDDDLSYERAIQKKCEKTGIRMLSRVFDEDVLLQPHIRQRAIHKTAANAIIAFA